MQFYAEKMIDTDYAAEKVTTAYEEYINSLNLTPEEFQAIPVSIKNIKKD